LCVVIGVPQVRVLDRKDRRTVALCMASAVVIAAGVVVFCFLE